MEDPVARLEQLWRRGESVVVATVCRTWRSAPRPPGSLMLVESDGQVVGSVSGGCVEAAVYEAAQQVRTTGRPVLHRYGVSDVDAWQVGLTCGGEMEVFLERVSPEDYPEFGSTLDGEDPPLAVATLIDHGDGGRAGAHLVVHADRAVGSLGSGRLDLAVVVHVRRSDLAGPVVLDLSEVEPGARVLVVPPSAPQRLVVCGASELVGAVTHLASLVGYRVTVCDARAAFATPRRFPHAAEVVHSWPDAYLRSEGEAGRLAPATAVAVLTHDPKFDVPALAIALGMPWLGFVGLLGSRRTCADRRRRLLDAGVSPTDLQRLRAPIGLDLGARSPSETAVSIVGEIIAARYAGTGLPLSATDGPMHRIDEPRPHAVLVAAATPHIGP